MYLKRIMVGRIQTNCYLAGDSDTNECIVIDPGDEAEKIAACAESQGRKITAIILTHGHFDHIGAVSYLKSKCAAKVYACLKEKDLLKEPELNLSVNINRRMSEAADVYVSEGDIIKEAGIELKVIETPGHTIGGVCYYCENDKVLFSGDTLFEMSVGRTDFPTSSSADLVKSVREKLFKLPDDVLVYPGHGGATDIGFEKINNMYV